MNDTVIYIYFAFMKMSEKQINEKLVSKTKQNKTKKKPEWLPQ